MVRSRVIGLSKWFCFRISLLLCCACNDDSQNNGPNAGPSSGEPLYLTFSGREGSEAEASLYIAANAQESTLDAFKQKRCLSDGLTLEYFNFTDLALGRRLSFARCQKRISACVENAGTPGQPAADGLHALDETTSVAVCMDYLPSRPAPFRTQFYVYANGVPETGLNFDRQGKKFSPFACTACHGGRYGSGAHQVENAFFLPLLKESLKFATLPKEDDLRQMNALIYDTNDLEQDAVGVRQLIDAAYPAATSGAGVHKLGTFYVSNAVPSIWAGQENLYQGLVRKHCLTCHATQIAGSYPLNTPDEFGTLKSLVQYALCDAEVMPNSLVGRINFIGDNTARQLAGCP